MGTHPVLRQNLIRLVLKEGLREVADGGCTRENCKARQASHVVGSLNLRLKAKIPGISNGIGFKDLYIAERKFI